MVFDHPKIVRMIGLCEQRDGSVYLLCEYVPGITMADRASQLEVASRGEKIRQITEDICSILPALEHMHKLGYIHRDIKPSNMMVDNSSNVKLMDLGIVAPMHMTQYGSREFVGTPEYASPEQIQCLPCDQRSDIYSLGVTMYELLTGTSPFRGETKEDTLYRQLQSPLPSNENIPDRLYKIIERATNKLPEQRYTTVEELKHDLTSYLNSDGESSKLGKETFGFDTELLLYIIIIGIVVIALFFLLFC
jgi:serine/threonine-protein kinase